MSRFKKPMAFVAIAGVSAAAALMGNNLVRDTQYAHAKDVVEAARTELGRADATQLSSVFRNVGKVMEPSVVSIEVHKAARTGRQALPFNDEQLRRFFPDRDGDGEPDLPPGLGDGGGGEDLGQETVGTGSGVIMEVQGGSGFILTNNHVAGGATEMTIYLADGRTIHNGKVLGTDPKSDLAVVKIEEPRLISAKWGDSSKLERGDFVLAFGSPFNYVGSMTHGIVSALNRQAGILADRQGYENFIQVDCPINPGNSGGPLTDLHGEVVGINTAIASRSGGFQGIGFAIPSNQAKFVFNQLKDKGKVVRGWLGVGISDVSRELPLAKSFGFDGTKGVLVGQIFPNTPAAERLERGDIITEVSGKPVETMTDLRNQVAASGPGTDLKMKVFRKGKYEEVTVRLGEQPEDLTAMAGGRDDGSDRSTQKGSGKVSDTLGLRFAPDEGRGRRRGAEPTEEGAVVASVQPRSAAAKAGLMAGDIVLEVGDQPVKSGSEANVALGKEDPSKGIRLYVKTADQARYVFIEPVDSKN